jgi:hypothetical protein
MSRFRDESRHRLHTAPVLRELGCFFAFREAPHRKFMNAAPASGPRRNTSAHAAEPTPTVAPSATPVPTPLVTEPFASMELSFSLNDEVRRSAARRNCAARPTSEETTQRWMRVERA